MDSQSSGDLAGCTAAGEAGMGVLQFRKLPVEPKTRPSVWRTQSALGSPAVEHTDPEGTWGWVDGNPGATPCIGIH